MNEREDCKTMLGASARMGTASQASRSTATPLAELCQRIERLAGRVDGIGTGMREVGNKLNAHADAVYGEGPAMGEEARYDSPGLGPVPYAGELGRVFAMLEFLNDQISGLDRAASDVATAAGRNSTLA